MALEKGKLEELQTNIQALINSNVLTPPRRDKDKLSLPRSKTPERTEKDIKPDGPSDIDLNLDNVSSPTTPRNRGVRVQQSTQKMTISSIMKMNKAVRDKMLSAEQLEKINYESRQAVSNNGSMIFNTHIDP